MIQCLNFRPCVRNTLRGYADLELPQTGIILADCTFHEKNGKQWVTFPAQARLGAGDTTQWRTVIKFAPGAERQREAFRRQAVEAINIYRQQHAEATP